jgi:hypothetical protein
VAVDGTMRIQLFTDGEWAWPGSAKEDDAKHAGGA